MEKLWSTDGRGPAADVVDVEHELQGVGAVELKMAAPSARQYRRCAPTPPLDVPHHFSVGAYQVVILRIRIMPLVEIGISLDENKRIGARQAAGTCACHAPEPAGLEP